MAHFAEIDETNTVLRTVVVNDSDADTDESGQEFLANTLGLGGTWLKTSYNTVGGVHMNGGTPLRKNFAGPGSTYDPINDAFIPTNIYPSWTLNTTSYLWEPPTPKPIDDKWYNWDEETTSWVEIEQ